MDNSNTRGYKLVGARVDGRPVTYLHRTSSGNHIIATNRQPMLGHILEKEYKSGVIWPYIITYVQGPLRKRNDSYRGDKHRWSVGTRQAEQSDFIQ